MEFSEIIASIHEWNAIRNETLGFNKITSGSCMKVTYEQFLQLDASNYDGNINFYIGIGPNKKPIFFLVSEHYDNPDIINNLDKILIISFEQLTNYTEMAAFELTEGKTEPTEVNKAVVLNRALRWILYQELWFSDNRTPNPEDSKIVRAFKIPVRSFLDLFTTENSAALLFFGIKFYEKSETNPDYLNEYNIEIILSKDTKKDYKIPELFTNVTKPCPPYSCGTYGLFNF